MPCSIRVKNTASSFYYFCLLFILFLILFFFYWPSLTGLPFSDDLIEVFNNSDFVQQRGFIYLWESRRWPIALLVQYLIHTVMPGNFLLFHGLNIIVHWLNGLLLFYLAKRIRFSHPWILLVLFLFHPSQVITISWMIQLKTLLSLFFSLCAVHCYFSWRESDDKDWFFYLHFMTFFILSLFTKSNLLLLPFVLFIYDYRYRRISLHIKRYWPYLLVLLVMVWNYFYFTGSKYSNPLGTAEMVGVLGTNSGGERTFSLISILSRIDFVLKCLFFYLKQSVWPWPVAAFYPPFSGVNGGGLSSLLLLFTGTFILMWRYSRVNFWIILCAVTLLLPVLGVIPAPYMQLFPVADYHLYAALPLLLAFAILFIDSICRKFDLQKSFSIYLIYFIGIILFSLSAFFIRWLQPHFADQQKFFEFVVETNPNYLPSYLSLKDFYLGQGDCEKAKWYDQQLKAISRQGKGHPKMAIEEFAKDILKCQTTIDR